MSDDRALQRLTTALADRYADLEEVGRGGMATVYRARDVRHDRVVAIKVLVPEFGVTLGADRFLHEIAIEAKLQHPNILALFDSGQAGEFLYFVTPFAAGGSLRDRLLRERPLAIDEALRITRQIGDALSYAHGEGVVHRDVKPANILFSTGHAMLADFGIARAATDIDRDRLTRSGVSIGTPAYMSPEQASGGSMLDARSDLYSLGCVLFEMLAGEPPFTGHNPQVVLARQISERPPSVEVARPGVPQPVAAALTQALAKIPADRQPTVEAFLGALESETGTIPTPRRSMWSASRVVASVVAAAAVFGSAWWLSRPEPPALSPDKVAVFPLATRGVGAESSLDGTGVSYLIEAALEHAEPLRMIDVATRLTEREMVDPSLITARSARDISRGLGAAFYVDGVVQGHRDSTTVILRLHDVRGDSIIGQRSVTGEIGVPMHHLGIDALRALLPSLIDPSVQVDLEPLRERKASAVALWLQAERAYRKASFRPALDLYERALADDSALAIAAVKGGQAADWLHENTRGRALVDLALARGSFLPHRYLALARGLRDFFGSQPDSAVYWLQEAASEYPDWWEAQAALGEVYYHRLPNSAPLDSLADVAFQRAIAADSSAPSAFHLIEMRIVSGRLAEADRLLTRYETGEPEGSLVTQLRLMRACVSEPRAMDWDNWTAQSSTTVLFAGKALAGGARQLPCAEGAFRSILRSATTSAGERWGAFLGLQGLLVASGRDLEARALIDSVAAQRGAARSLYVLGALAGARMDEAAAELDAYARNRFGPTYEGVATGSLWILSAWLRHDGDSVALAAVDSAIFRRTRTDGGTMSDSVFAAVTAAAEAAIRDPARGIRELSRLPHLAFDSLTWGFTAPWAPERLTLARMLADAGRYRESLLAASVFDHPEPILFLEYAPISLAIRYRAARALGDDAAAERFRSRLQALHRLELIDQDP